MSAALTILAIAASLGSLFVIGAFVLGSDADDASDDLSERLAHGDWPAISQMNVTEHDAGRTTR